MSDIDAAAVAQFYSFFTAVAVKQIIATTTNLPNW